MNDDTPRKPPINPFLVAKKSPDVIAAIDVRNVLALRPTMTQDEAAAFLTRYNQMIAIVMLEAGVAILRHLLEDTHVN